MQAGGGEQVGGSFLLRNQSIDFSNKRVVKYKMKVFNILSADDVRSVVPSADLHRDQQML